MHSTSILIVTSSLHFNCDKFPQFGKTPRGDQAAHVHMARNNHYRLLKALASKPLGGVDSHRRHWIIDGQKPFWSRSLMESSAAKSFADCVPQFLMLMK